MQDLVQLALQAHGGFSAWSRVERVTAAFTVSGAGLLQRGPVGAAFAGQTVEIDVEVQSQTVTITPFLAPGQRAVYRPYRTAVEMSDGQVVEYRDAPREAAMALAPGEPWPMTALVYFIGYSLWMYLNLPYAFVRAGVKSEEIAPLILDGETLRALKVGYPASFASHSAEQIHYFDAEGLMRRQDYSVAINGAIPVVHLLEDYVRVDGFAFAATRRIFLRGPDGAPVWDKPLLTAHFADIRIAYRAGDDALDGDGLNWCVTTCD